MAEILQGKKFKCAFCTGTGIQPRSLKSRCLACRGKGEVEFEGPAITCPSCKGKGKSSGALGLACIRCKGLGAVAQKEAIDTLGERLGEIVQRLKPFIKEVKKEIVWIKKLENNLKKVWGSLWKD